MKKSPLIFLLVLFSFSCGTIGHVQFYNFSVSKYEAEKEIIKVINKDSSYSAPGKWKDTIGLSGPIELIYVYFSSSPEEMYQVGFTGDSFKWKTSSVCRLSLDGVFDGDRWRFESDLSSKEQKRIQKRFEDRILSKMNLYYYKSN